MRSLSVSLDYQQRIHVSGCRIIYDRSFIILYVNRNVFPDGDLAVVESVRLANKQIS